MIILAATLALVLAFPIAMMSLITLQKYTRTYFLLTKCWQFYTYGFTYGLIAFLIVLIIPPSILRLPNIWVEAFTVGLSTKAVLNTVFISLPKPDGLKLDGGEPIHVGPQLVMTLIEFFILPDMRSYYEKRLNTFIDEKAQHYTSVSCVQEIILSHPPTYIEDDKIKRKTFQLDIKKPLEDNPFEDNPSVTEYMNVRQLMRTYLNFVGREYFDSLFTCKPDSHINECTCKGRVESIAEFGRVS